MKVLSLFDGISCARVALERAGIEVEEYYASEIEIASIEVAQNNYPETIQCGDVRNITYRNGKLILEPFQMELDDEIETKIDLIIGGSPCQDLSIAGKREGIKGERSSLVHEFARLLKEVKPKYFILENVASMTKENIDAISDLVGVKPIMIDAGLVSAQRRKRLFWSNIPNITLPQDKELKMKDIWIDDGKWEYEYLPISGSTRAGNLPNVKNNAQAGRVYPLTAKGVTLTALAGGLGGKAGIYAIDEKHARRPYPIECERLQGLPDDYTKYNEDGDMVPDETRKKMVGNAFNVDVVAHILSFIPHETRS